MKNVKSFLLNLTDEDIDLIDKLDNMDGSEIFNDVLLNILSTNEDIQKQILRCVRIVVENGIDDYCSFIKNETDELYEQGLIEKDDYSAGLYNCDEIYVQAIEMALLLNFVS